MRGVIFSHIAACHLEIVMYFSPFSRQHFILGPIIRPRYNIIHHIYVKDKIFGQKGPRSLNPRPPSQFLYFLQRSYSGQSYFVVSIERRFLIFYRCFCDLHLSVLHTALKFFERLAAYKHAWGNSIEFILVRWLYCLLHPTPCPSSTRSICLGAFLFLQRGTRGEGKKQ